MRRLRLLWFAGMLAGIVHGLVAAEENLSASNHVWKPLLEWMPDTRKTHPALAPGLECSEPRIKIGDDARWADPAWDDRDWTVINYQGVPTHSGIGWLRFRVRVPKEGAPLPPLLAVGLSSAVEIFWDGEKIGSSGTPGDSALTEHPGIGGGNYTLPAEKRAPGEHLIALRFSNYLLAAPLPQTRMGMLIVDPVIFQQEHAKTLLPFWVTVSGLGLLALVTGSMWLLAGRRRSLLLLTGIFLCSVLSAGTGILTAEFGMRYDWGILYDNTKYVILIVIAVLIVAFAAERFALPKAWWGVAAVGIGLLLALLLKQGSRNEMPLVCHIIAYAAAIGCSLYGLWRKKRGAWLILIGGGIALAWLVADPISSRRPSLFFRSAPLFLAFVGSVALDVRAERRQAQQAQLVSARLEIQLLKKNLQPHFLFNTLAALSEVVESDPKLAVKLIHHLAEEFRVLVRVSKEKEIPLRDELELCQTHLAIMSVRTETAWTLAAEGVNPDDRVPPALFLTLIENAFAHQRSPAGQAAFVLRGEMIPDGARYTFFSPGEVTARPAAESTGTGTRYVKARLEESFPSAWEFSQREAPGGWQTTITWRRSRVAQAHGA